MITEDKIQHHIDEAKRELNTAITLAVEFGKQSKQDTIVWRTDEAVDLPDGDYVGVLPSGGKVFVSAYNGKLYPNAYCKHFVKWCRLPE